MKLRHEQSRLRENNDSARKAVENEYLEAKRKNI
jgi:hypothetical protein